MRQKKLLMLCVAGAVIVLSGCKGSTNVKNNNIFVIYDSCYK